MGGELVCLGGGEFGEVDEAGGGFLPHGVDVDAAGAVGVFGVGFVDVDVEVEGVVGFGGEIVNDVVPRCNVV